jgi:4-hydroxybenzoate polyprenyltransferase
MSQTTTPPTHRLLERVQEYAELVKFEHTIFALPFALSAMLLACPPSTWPSPWTVLWVLLAMVGGRTYAMALNRLIDHSIDGANPRTKNRSIPAGRVKKAEAWFLTLLAAGLFTAATFQLPTLCQQLLPVAFFILTIYSFVKRFSSMAHLVLGVALGSSAVGGWLAVTGELSWLPVIFGFAVVFWVSGFDLIYACQDYDFDKEAGLHSIPVALGIAGALTLSKVFHLLCVGLLVGFGLLYDATGWGYWLATLITAGMLIYEHRLVSPDNLSQVNEAFFTVNGRISITVFLLVLLDKLLQ